MQRNGLDEFVAGLKRTSDLTMLGVLLPHWSPKPRSREEIAAALQTIPPAQDQKEVDRFKGMVFVLGEGPTMQLHPRGDELYQARSFEDVGGLLVTLGLPVASALELGRRWTVTLAQILRAALKFPTVDIGALRPVIRAAPDSERQAAWNDRAILSTARAKSRDLYLTMLPALGIFEAPALGRITSPMPSRVADQHIRKYLRDLGQAVKQGAGVEGEVSVVGDADFQLAFERQWIDKGYFPRGTSAIATCNAFVDVDLAERHIWIHKDYFPPGTVIHEGMHKYANDTLRATLRSKYPATGTGRGISQLDEGVTEYFTREICDSLSIPRTYYPNQYLRAKQLVAVVGQPVMRGAYFDGNYTGLKAAYDTNRSTTPGGWETVAEAIERQNWPLADKYL